MPTLIRTLGPEFFGLSGKDVTIERRKMALTRRLIEGLSGLAHFEQIFDHRVGDAATFVRHRDFGVTVEYAYRAEAGISEAESWSRMTDKVRNTIRSAARQFKVIKIDDAGAFCRFHDACLRGLPNHHGSARMARLVTAVQTHRAGQMLAAVDRNGAMVAALLAVWDADAVRNLIVARDLERCGNGALSLLLSHAMRIAERRGVAFDFDGAVTQGQLSFLSGFGAGLVQRLVVWRTEPGYLPARRNVLAINRA